MRQALVPQQAIEPTPTGPWLPPPKLPEPKPPPPFLNCPAPALVRLHDELVAKLPEPKPPPPRMNLESCGPAHFILDRTRQWVHLPKEMFMIMAPPPLLNCPNPPCGPAHFNLDRAHK